MSKWKLDSLLVCAVATLTPLPVAGQILPPGASVERLATGYSFTEGPAYDGEGSLYFTNIYFSATPSQIIRYDVAAGTTEVVDGNSGQANGLFFDHNGQIVSMDMGGDRRQVSRRAADDISIVEEVLASGWNGIQFNSTNDLVIAQDGGIYFSDPDYLGRQAQPDAVYYLNPGGELSQIISGFPRPNGIVLSPDGQTLYLAVSEESRIMAYDVAEDGLPKNEREFARTNGGPDGMTVDPAGNVYAAVENAVSAWDATGQPLFDLSVPERASNVTFGGVDGRTLFITASSSLYGVTFVPEPSGMALACLALFGAIGVRQRKHRHFAHVQAQSDKQS
jgi:gluconolactonase